jgi:hypothetical protein
MITKSLNFFETMKKLIVLFSILSICLSGFSQSRYISETIKKIVYSRDGGACQCCGSSASLEYDHITPYSCGGSSTDASNIQLLCMRCNRSKSNSCNCKIHDRRVGTNCCDGETTKSTSSNSSAVMARQCTGTTLKGTRCRNRTKNASGRCHLH